MGDAEVFPRQTVKKITGYGFARGIADAVYQTVKDWPVTRQVSEQLVDLCIVAHVTVKNQAGAEICREFGGALLEAFPHIAEGQFGALLVAGASNTVSNRPVGKDAGDQYFFAVQETHIVLKISAVN